MLTTCLLHLDVDVPISIQRVDATGDCVSSLTWCVSVEMLLLSRRLVLVPTAVVVAASNARLRACPSGCHEAGGPWTWMWL